MAAADDLLIANPRPPQRFLLDRVARGGGVGAFEVAAALVLDRVDRRQSASTISRSTRLELMQP